MNCKSQSNEDSMLIVKKIIITISQDNLDKGFDIIIKNECFENLINHAFDNDWLHYYPSFVDTAICTIG